MSYEFDQRIPVYLQVIALFKQRIATRELAPGQEIPSRRELAAQLGINPNTAQRAYKEMEEQQLITTERNVPSRITMDERIVEKIRSELLEAAVTEFIQSVQAIGAPLPEVVGKIEQAYANRGKQHA
ncbi:GntR family transcriptional regulator [Exiguobacterium flavidum]|uniref:GntR family transcriptional regulator n=1 Tax=Exiguobacterium flavidum TaxID=2184695 RepID=UPI000DF80E4F|nr:GntR family transcriptional regulator [Exiguobacterium flavidum]